MDNLVGGLITGGLGLPSGSGTFATMNLYDVYIIPKTKQPSQELTTGGGGYFGGAWNVFPDSNFLIPIQGSDPPFYVPAIDEKRWKSKKSVRIKMKLPLHEQEIVSDHYVPTAFFGGGIKVKPITEIKHGIDIRFGKVIVNTRPAKK